MPCWVRAHQHRDVEDAVLARADELLAVEQQHAPVGEVLERELGHAAALGDFGHARALRG